MCVCKSMCSLSDCFVTVCDCESKFENTHACLMKCKFVLLCRYVDMCVFSSEKTGMPVEMFGVGFNHSVTEHQVVAKRPRFSQRNIHLFVCLLVAFISYCALLYSTVLLSHATLHNRLYLCTVCFEFPPKWCGCSTV